MFSDMLGKPDGNRVADLHRNVLVGPEEHITVRERLYGSRFAQGYRPVLFGVSVSAVGDAVAATRKGRGGAVPRHPSIHVGMPLVIPLVTFQPQAFRPRSSVPTVMRRMAETLNIQFRDGRGNVVRDISMAFSCVNHRKVGNDLSHRPERAKIASVLGFG